jgi:hypothetical protein
MEVEEPGISLFYYRIQSCDNRVMCDLGFSKRSNSSALLCDWVFGVAVTSKTPAMLITPLFTKTSG